MKRRHMKKFETGYQNLVALIDLDNVVTDTDASLEPYLRERGLEPPMPKAGTWNMSDIPKEYADVANEAFSDPDFYYRAKPIPYSVGSLRELARATKWQIVFITSRPFYNHSARFDAICQATRDYLYKEGLHQHEVLYAESKDKLGLALHRFGENIAFIVEDSPTTAPMFAQAGIRAYMVKQKYNEPVPDMPNLLRVDSLQIALEHARGLLYDDMHTAKGTLWGNLRDSALTFSAPIRIRTNDNPYMYNYIADLQPPSSERVNSFIETLREVVLGTNETNETDQSA